VRLVEVPLLGERVEAPLRLGLVARLGGLQHRRAQLAAGQLPVVEERAALDRRARGDDLAVAVVLAGA
jgi:hypothetical protein